VSPFTDHRDREQADGSVAVAERERPTARDASSPDAVRDRQREEFGGFSWGSAFFGWLVAVGMAALLTALLSAAGAAIGLASTSEQEAAGAADTIGIPRIPIDEGTVTTGGLIALATVVAATLLAAIAGGKAGTHYHRKIDQVGY
jgi:hypothetical protein